jgi:hypothetical protein
MLGGGGQRLAVVLDASASMAARDVQPSRFTAARQVAVDTIAAASPETRVSLVVAGAQPRVVADNTSAAQALDALDGVQVELKASDLADAIRVAAGLAAPDAANGSQVVAVTDGAVDLDLSPQAVPVSFRLVGGGGDNLAVSEVTLRRPLDRADYLAGFARLVNFTGESRETAITIVADALPVDRAPVTVPAMGHAEATFKVPASAQTVSVILAQRDDMPIDDGVAVPGYARWIRRATIVSEAPALYEHVLSVVPDLAVRSVRPQDLPTTELTPVDIVVFDNVVPAVLPANPVILINPPESSTLLPRTDPLPRQRRVVHAEADDPLLHGLDLAPLSVQQVLRTDLPDWAASAADAEDTPLVLHGQLNGSRVVVLTFDPNHSNLPHLAAFPVLMANAVDWLTPGREALPTSGLGAKTAIQPRPLADLPSSTATGSQPALTELWPWLVAAVGVFFLLEWAVAVRRG